VAKTMEDETNAAFMMLKETNYPALVYSVYSILEPPPSRKVRKPQKITPNFHGPLAQFLASAKRSLAR